VAHLIRSDVARVNRTLPPVSQVRKYALLHKEFDADEEDLTRTRKLKRGSLTKRYASLVEALYDGHKDEVEVEAEITYQDGRKALLKTGLKIHSMQ